MPSFDIVSKVDQHELTNAVDQANREVTTRFDFKDSGAEFTLDNETIHMKASADFQLQQMKDVLQNKMVKRSVDIRSLEFKDVESNLNEARQDVVVKQGIDQAMSKKISKLIKSSKLKVQASIQDEQVRVTGKKRDDLQEAMAFLKEAKLELPLQYENFRD